MNRILALLVILSSCGLGVSQSLLDTGVENTTDEFTGERDCSQIVFHSRYDFTGIGLASDPKLETLVTFMRHLESVSDATFNMFGRLSGDRVYVRFPSTGEVLELTPFETTVISEGGMRVEAAAIFSDSLAAKVMSSPTDLRIRFAGSDGNRDFTIQHDVVVALAQGFGRQCLD